MPNQDPTQTQDPVSPPADQAASANPPVIFPQSDLPPLPPAFQDLPKSDDQPVATPPATNPPADEPPVQESVVGAGPVNPKPKKKFGGGKIIATILGLVVLVGGVGAGIILTQQQQVLKERAYHSKATFTDPCGDVNITATGNTECPQLNNGKNTNGTNNVSSYWTTFEVKNLTDKQLTVNLRKKSNYCTEPYGQWSDAANNYICGSEPQSDSQQLVLAPKGDPSDTQTVTITRSSDTPGVACGSYQTDLILDSIAKGADATPDPSCHGDLSQDNLASWGICQTGIACSSSSPSPTPSPTPSATVPDCTSLKLTTPDADINNLTVGQSYAFNLTAGGSAPISDIALSIHNGTVGQNCDNFTDITKQGGTSTTDISWTPTVAGTYTLFGRVWNDGIAECRADCVDGVPRYSCSGSSSCRLTVNVQGAAPSCIPIKTYDNSWTDISGKLASLVAGDKVSFCVNGSGGTFTKAQFKINTTVEPEMSTHDRPGSTDYCQSYTIQSNDSTVTVLSKIYDSVSGGWIGDTTF